MRREIHNDAKDKALPFVFQGQSGAICTLVAIATATLLAGCEAPAPKGSYKASCKHIVEFTDGSLKATCATRDSKFRTTLIAADKCQGDISNDNGALACVGATAQDAN